MKSGTWEQGRNIPSSLSHGPLLSPRVQDPRKAKPACHWSGHVPRPCSCHSCRSTGLQGAGSGSQTPPPRNSGGPRRCHGAAWGRAGGGSEPLLKTPSTPTASSRAAPGPRPSFLHQLHPTDNRAERRGKGGAEGQRGREKGEPGGPRDVHRQKNIPAPKIKKEKDTKKRKGAEDTKRLVGRRSSTGRQWLKCKREAVHFRVILRLKQRTGKKPSC